MAIGPEGVAIRKLLDSLPRFEEVKTFQLREPTAHRVVKWGFCPTCKQSFTNCYLGVPKCTRCVGRTHA